MITQAIEGELLTATERADLIQATEPRLTSSLVQYGPDRRTNVKLRVSVNHRWWTDSEITLKLRGAVAELLDVELERVEAVDVVRYRPGGFFGNHHDGKHRSHTVCLTLSDDFEGGLLVFPELDLEYRILAGRAIVWSNEDPKTIHRSDPITSGEKWIAVVWVQADLG